MTDEEAFLIANPPAIGLKMPDTSGWTLDDFVRHNAEALKAIRRTQELAEADFLLNPWG